MRNRTDLAERVEKALRGAAIWDEVKDRLTDSALALSGGQMQRLCIARALATEPEILLFDEPTSALDPIATAKIEELITELREHVTILIVTHNMQQAARVSDFTAFMYLGELVEVDATVEDLHESLEEGDRRLHHGPLRLNGGDADRDEQLAFGRTCAPPRMTGRRQSRTSDPTEAAHLADRRPVGRRRCACRPSRWAGSSSTRWRAAVRALLDA